MDYLSLVTNFGMIFSLIWIFVCILKLVETNTKISVYEQQLSELNKEKPKRKRKPQGAYDAVDWDAVSAKQKMVYEMLDIKRDHAFEMEQLNKKHMEQVSKYSEEIVSLSDENQRLREVLREHGIAYVPGRDKSYVMRKVDSDE